MGVYLQLDITEWSFTIEGQGKERITVPKTMQVKFSVFIGSSVDGFIARANGELDFLPMGGGEDYGYKEFMAGVDTLVIGRGTYETVMKYPEWPYGQKRVVVLSGAKLDLQTVRTRGARVEQMSGEPTEIMAKLERSGTKSVYIDGGVTIQRFLRAGLIGKMIITRVPVLIGQGIPLFGPLERDIALRHMETKSYPSGFVKSEYEVIPEKNS
jgi:dihydrofolate reductase